MVIPRALLCTALVAGVSRGQGSPPGIPAFLQGSPLFHLMAADSSAGSWEPPDSTNDCDAHADCAVGQFCSAQAGSSDTGSVTSCAACPQQRYRKGRCPAFDGDCCSRQILGKCPALASPDQFDCNRPCSSHQECDCDTYCSADRLCETCAGAPPPPTPGAHSGGRACNAVDGDCCSADFLDRCPMPNIFDSPDGKSICPAEIAHTCAWDTSASASAGYDGELFLPAGGEGDSHSYSDRDLPQTQGVTYRFAYDQANKRARFDLENPFMTGWMWIERNATGVWLRQQLKCFSDEHDYRSTVLSAAAAEAQEGIDLLFSPEQGLVAGFLRIPDWRFGPGPNQSSHIEATSMRYAGDFTLAGVKLQLRKRNSCIVNDLLNGRRNLSSTTNDDPPGYSRTIKVNPATCQIVEMENVEYDIGYNATEACISESCGIFDWGSTCRDDCTAKCSSGYHSYARPSRSIVKSRWTAQFNGDVTPPKPRDPSFWCPPASCGVPPEHLPVNCKADLCPAEEARLCASSKGAGAGNCFICLGAHQAQLMKAGCTQDDFNKFCTTD